MPNSLRMGWPYPSENADPWYDAFEALVSAADLSAQAAHEDRNLVLSGGGILSFNATANTLTSAGEIRIVDPVSGFYTGIAAGTLNGVVDGTPIWLNLPRSLTANASGTLLTGAVPGTSASTAYVLAVRVGGRLYFRNGDVLLDGEAYAILELGQSTVAVQEEGVAAGVRQAINFQGVAVTATDDGGNSRVNVAITEALDYQYVTGTTATANKPVVIVNASGNAVITLPTAASSARRLFWVKSLMAAFTVTIDGDGAETIDGAATYVLTTQYESVRVFSGSTDGGATYQWFTLA